MKYPNAATITIRKTEFKAVAHRLWVHNDTVLLVKMSTEFDLALLKARPIRIIDIRSDTAMPIAEVPIKSIR